MRCLSACLRLVPWVVGCVGFALSGTAWAQIAYPGAAPCGGTLQACIDGVAAGETVEIATAVPIDESLVINKNLTLRAAAGVNAILLAAAGQNTVVLSDTMGPVDVRVEGLRLVRTTLAVLAVADGSVFTVVGNWFQDDGGSEYAIDARLNADQDLLVELNQFEWTGPTMLLRTAGSQETDIIEAVIRANRFTSNTSDEILGPSAGGVLVEAGGEPWLQLRFDSNVLFDLDGVGGPAGIEVTQMPSGILTMSAAPSVNAEVVDNTLHQIAGGGPAIEFVGPSFTPITEGPGGMIVYVFNNIVSSTGGPALSVVEPLDNIFFRNDANDLWDNDAPVDIGGAPLGAATLMVDPQFVDAVGGDLRLAAASPLIDAGINSVPAAVPFPAFDIGPIDVTGGPRLIGPLVDIGAYEGGAAEPAPVEVPTQNVVGLFALAGFLGWAALFVLARSS